MSDVPLPMGFKTIFDPEDHELMFYLNRKANGQQLPCDHIITEVDLYNTVDPGKLFPKGENIIYRFTKVKKVSSTGKGKKVIRRVSSSDLVWRGIVGAETIKNEVDCEVGVKRKFSFMNNERSNERKNLGYDMTEFVLDKKSLEKAKFKDYVLCKITRNLKKARGSIGIQGGEDFGFQENRSDNTASSTAATDSQNDPEQTSNAGINYWQENLLLEGYSVSENEAEQELAHQNSKIDMAFDDTIASQIVMEVDDVIAMEPITDMDDEVTFQL